MPTLTDHDMDAFTPLSISPNLLPVTANCGTHLYRRGLDDYHTAFLNINRLLTHSHGNIQRIYLRSRSFTA